MHRMYPGVLISALVMAATGTAPARAQTATHGEQHAAGHQPAGGHQFHILPNGGIVELQGADTAGIAHVREHLRELTRAFAAAEPPADLVTHMRCMPGGSTMLAKRSVLTLAFRELPHGGELRITTQDPEALAAVHEFLAFQREQHGNPAAHAQDTAHHGDQRGCGGNPARAQ